LKNTTPRRTAFFADWTGDVAGVIEISPKRRQRRATAGGNQA
jgi:hypothetical protein